MYLDIERRRRPQKWESRSRTTKGKSQSVAAAGMQFRGAAQAQPPEAGVALSAGEARELHEKLRVLTDANRELEAFNVTVSHDLCTPLTTINGYCQVLKEICRDQLDDSAQEYLQSIYLGTLRMKELVASMLDFSRGTRLAGIREKIDLSATARAVAEELRLSTPPRRVAFRVSPGLTEQGDPGLWRSVLDNLIGNAWKHSAGREDTVVDFGRRQLGGLPVYFVRDNGPGFDMALADRLFLPFQRAPGTKAEGVGIGLATVDRIVRRDGGRVWAESAPGRGATFYFTME